MSSAIRSLGLLVFLLASPLGQAKSGSSVAPAPQQSRTNTEQDFLGGVITSRTITVLGWDFYQYFTAIWQAKYGNERISLSVYERPTAQWGSEIWIDYGQKRVFHAFLPPARAATKDVSMQAVDIVHKSVVDINVQRALYSDLDLAPEEM